jgi:hypothetical protein
LNNVKNVNIWSVRFDKFAPMLKIGEPKWCPLSL